MTEDIKDIKPFKQVPYCDKDTVLSITGAEYEALQSIINAFAAPLAAIQSIFQRNIDEGNITIKFVQADGKEITKDEATEYLRKASEHLKKASESLKGESEKTPN